jgi:hypothetical protein
MTFPSTLSRLNPALSLSLSYHSMSCFPFSLSLLLPISAGLNVIKLLLSMIYKFL